MRFTGFAARGRARNLFGSGLEVLVRLLASLRLAHAQGEYHRHARAISAIGVAVKANQISLLELNRHEDVGGRRQREDKVSRRHTWRGPEDAQPTQVDRVAHVTIEP